MRVFWLLAVAMVLLLAACDTEDNVTSPAGPALVEAPVAEEGGPATPTLAPGLPTATPQPPTPLPGEPTATATPSATPTATLSATEHREMAETLLGHQNYGEAATHLEQSLAQRGALTVTVQLETLYQLGVTYLQDGRPGEAAQSLNQYLAAAAENDAMDPAQTAAAYFYLGQAYAATGDIGSAIGAYQSYLEAHPDMAAYVQPRLAELYLAQEETAGAIAAYEAAIAAGAHRLHEIANRQALADLYMSTEAYAAAQAQYDAIYAMAVTDNTRGQMTYLAGRAALLAGDRETGYGRYLRGIREYPAVHESYLGLIELVEAGVEVDNFQRGLVDYYAEVYQPAIAAFELYMTGNADDYRPDTHLYLAWCYEALGEVETALAQIELYATYGATAEEPRPQAARALLERAELLARAGRSVEALSNYNALLESFPDDEGAVQAAWQLAVVNTQARNVAEAIAAYQSFAETYPADERAPEGLLAAGRLARDQDDLETAQALWRQLADGYPQSDAGAAAYIWLLRTTPAAESEALAAEVMTRTLTTGYYALRAREVAQGEAAFSRPEAYEFEFNEVAAMAETEAWLREHLPGVQVTATLTSSVTMDERFIRAGKLWALGLAAEARQEFEAVRSDYAGNMLVSYQLALYFRDVGLYRSSLAAASSLLALSGESIYDAPSLVGRLLYPIYYAELVLPLAEEYGYDPLLQFALIRQESLFESFATSYVGAQGLSQVMPATGDYIAGRLGWPEYETADLNRPYVGLAFGAYYLDQQLEAFDGHVFVALSAYNGGPGNAARWYEAAGGDLDRYLEAVDFSETRLYIRRIYEGYHYYRFLYGREADE